MGGFCDIKSRDDLADFLGIPRRNLTYILYIKKTDSFYESFTIPKKNGGERNINAPEGDLKSIQVRLASALWKHQCDIWKEYKIKPNISHAFEKNKSIITNAVIHRNKRYILNIDLEDFFDCFHFGRVKGFFEKNRNFKLPTEVATIIAQITCFNGCLPQGAPSSPIITNLICQILDNRLSKLSKAYKLDYTRYADDLTFSTNSKDFLTNYQTFFQKLEEEIIQAGFRINTDKTSLRYRDSKQVVTGLIVNKKINVDRSFYRETRAMANCLYTKGYFDIHGATGTINQLEGRFSFINQIDEYTSRLEEQRCPFKRLNSREKQYQKLLFFKHFYANESPLIVTEGKTDIIYLRAALKNLYQEYPTLVSKTDNEKFEFKISFLRKTSNLKNILGINQDGADTMVNIYNMYVGNGGFPNYSTWFKGKCILEAQSPVILVFDNELKTKNKPLKKFVSYIGFEQNKTDSLSKNLGAQVIDNLYLVTNPLVGRKDECEIEDLFPKEILSHKINGKSFSRDSNFDIDKFYGKANFSKYISENYSEIDFKNFIPLLNRIEEIVENNV